MNKFPTPEVEYGNLQANRNLLIKKIELISEPEWSVHDSRTST